MENYTVKIEILGVKGKTLGTTIIDGESIKIANLHNVNIIDDAYQKLVTNVLFEELKTNS